MPELPGFAASGRYRLALQLSGWNPPGFAAFRLESAGLCSIQAGIAGLCCFQAGNAWLCYFSAFGVYWMEDTAPSVRITSSSQLPFISFRLLDPSSNLP